MPRDVPPVQQKTRTYQYDVAEFDAAAALTMTGLEYMQAMVAGEIGARPSMAATMGMSLPMDLGHGTVAIEADPSDFVMNPLGVAHGGFAATLLDTVLGVSVHTALPVATAYTTAELKVNFTRAIMPTTGRLRATGNVIHLGRQMATSEGKLVGVDDGKLYAHGSTTCFIFPIRTGRA